MTHRLFGRLIVCVLGTQLIWAAAPVVANPPPPPCPQNVPQC